MHPLIPAQETLRAPWNPEQPSIISLHHTSTYCSTFSQNYLRFLCLLILLEYVLCFHLAPQNSTRLALQPFWLLLHSPFVSRNTASIFLRAHHFCTFTQLVLWLAPFHVSGLPWSSNAKESACNAGDPGLSPGVGRSPGEGNGNPLQDSCLENPMDRGAWCATVHGLTKRRT